MNLLILVVPKKLIVALKGALENSMDFVEGLYTLGSNQINGKPHWIQDEEYWIEDRGMAIWYKENHWNIGNIEDLGSCNVIMYSSGDAVGPYEPSTWHYFNYDDDDWSCFETTDVLILPTQGIFLFKS